MDGTIEVVTTVLNTALSHGVITLVGTVLSAPIENMRCSMRPILGTQDRQTAGMSRGLSPLQKRAQSLRHLFESSLQVYKSLVDGFKERTKIFALASELPEAREVIYRLKEDRIRPALAHSKSTFEETKEAIEVGVGYFTHFFNGMREFHHRDPGVVVAPLLPLGVTLELIADGIHVHPEPSSNKGIDSICLITNCHIRNGLARW